MVLCHADLENSRGQERWVKPLWRWIWRFLTGRERRAIVHRHHHGGEPYVRLLTSRGKTKTSGRRVIRCTDTRRRRERDHISIPAVRPCHYRVLHAKHPLLFRLIFGHRIRAGIATHLRGCRCCDVGGQRRCSAQLERCEAAAALKLIREAKLVPTEIVQGDDGSQNRHGV